MERNTAECPGRDATNRGQINKPVTLRCGGRLAESPGQTQQTASRLRHRRRGGDPGALFCPIHKVGRVTIRRMHPEAVFFALQKRAEQAGVSDLSPHDLRRTFAGDLLDSGAPNGAVQALGRSAERRRVSKNC